MFYATINVLFEHTENLFVEERGREREREAEAEKGRER
jgi:hypothetical protein